MTEPTLAEKLRDWVGKADVAHEAQGAERFARLAAEEDGITLLRDARTYLRGHDDRQSEVDALTARVNDLESMVESMEKENSAQAARVRELEAQPAAVGVVGAVRYGARFDSNGNVAALTFDSLEVAREFYSTKSTKSQPWRASVVAIVDPDAIVPLASGRVARWVDDESRIVYMSRELATEENETTVTPLYPGIAQPAQEREG
jgi:hypothetical protein